MSDNIDKAVALDMLTERSGEIKRLRAALQEIAKGEGEFSHNQLIHACNTIDNMKEIARAALSPPPPSGEGGK